MSRIKIVGTLESCAKELGYVAYSADKQEISQSIKEYPAIWINLPKVTKVQGQSQRSVTFSVEITLLQIAKKLTPMQKNEIWDKIEDDALKIVKLMNQCPDIRFAQIQKTTPEQFTITNQGEISLAVELSVELIPEKI